jgi:predicted NACHT family NTPase
MNPPLSLSGSAQPTSWLSRFTNDARYLRAVLTFLSKASEEQVKQIPGIGPLLLGFAESVKELSEQEDDDQAQREIEAKLAALLTQGEQAQRNSEAFAAFAGFLLEQQFQQTALLTQLTTYLQSLGLPAERKQLTEFACNAALVAYRSRVIRDYQYADQRGIQGVTRSEHVASLPLTDIYVKPRLQSERAADRSLFESRERERELLKQMLDNQDLPTSQQARLEEEFALLTGERWRGKKEQEATLGIGETLQRARHTVILGGPGVGKSQLARYLALVCARSEASMSEQLGWAEELTPLVVSLAAFADARSRNQHAQPLTLRQHLDAELERRGGAALRMAIEQEMQAGRVLVLLDGVDEVPGFNERSAIVVEVDSFLRDHGAIRCLVTSRPFGYIRLAGDVAHFELLNFSEERVGEFIRRWQRAFEEWQHRNAPNYEAAAREAEEMFDELKGNPKVLELATNPLMLVIIALIRYEQTRLPQERVRLYDTAVKTLMETWNLWRSKVAGVSAETKLKTDDLIIVWSAVAEWTRRTKPTGIVHRGELKTKLVEILLAEELGDPKPAETAEAYLDAAARRAGLLEERGPDIFAFWHPTFEEYLAAVNLTTPAHRAKGSLLPLRHDPRWREVILLAVGHLGLIQRDRETASELVRALACDEPDALEPVLHRNLLLAAACVADDVGVKRNVGEEVIVALGKAVHEQPYEQLCKAFVGTVRALPRSRVSKQGIVRLTHLVEHEESEVRMEAARLFSNVSDENAEARRCVKG